MRRMAEVDEATETPAPKRPRWHGLAFAGFVLTIATWNMTKLSGASASNAAQTREWDSGLERAVANADGGPIAVVAINQSDFEPLTAALVELGIRTGGQHIYLINGGVDGLANDPPPGTAVCFHINSPATAPIAGCDPRRSVSVVVFGM